MAADNLKADIQFSMHETARASCGVEENLTPIHKPSVLELMFNLSSAYDVLTRVEPRNFSENHWTSTRFVCFRPLKWLKMRSISALHPELTVKDWSGDRVAVPFKHLEDRAIIAKTRFNRTNIRNATKCGKFECNLGSTHRRSFAAFACSLLKLVVFDLLGCCVQFKGLVEL
ncbi:unnamed protein product [Clavelina lepadiformis]|uniref:Uncharacterized protein n=1 Tax=Clavelina lepadiformis TaxID=159417 RepID=A0ABP0FRI8_CLALP